MPEEWRANYLGGRGLALRYLLDNLARGLAPFDPESEIVFMTGPLAGTLVPTSSRLAIAARSPITGKGACGVVVSGAAAELKLAGYDGLVVSGRAASPTFVYVTNQRVTFERANLLWGKGAAETEKTIREKKWTHMARTLSIGAAGENLVPHASVVADGYGQIGELGAGAIMGSKNLKAVVVRGQAGIRVADMEGLLDLVHGAWGDGSRGYWQLWSDTPATSGEVVPEQPPGQALPALLTRMRVCALCPLSRPADSTGASGAAIQRQSYCAASTTETGLDVAEAAGLYEWSRRCDDQGLDPAHAADVPGFAAGTTGEAPDAEPLSPDTLVRDSLVLCNLWRPQLDTIAMALTMATGVPSGKGLLVETGARLLDLERRASATGPLRGGSQ